MNKATAEIDIVPKVQPSDRFSYVKLMDSNAKRSVDGADIDAIGAIGSILRDETDENTSEATTDDSCACGVKVLLESRVTLHPDALSVTSKWPFYRMNS